MPNQAKTSSVCPSVRRARVESRKEGPRKGRIFFLSIWHATTNTNRRAARAPWPAGWDGWANSRSLSRCHFPACPT